MTSHRWPRASALALAALMMSGAGLAACGGSAPPTTTTTTTTTTIPLTRAAERALYRGWCALKPGAASTTATAKIGPPYRSGAGPLELFHQSVPQGVTYAVWASTDYVLDAWFVSGKIYSLTAFPRAIPPALKLGCSEARKA